MARIHAYADKANEPARNAPVQGTRVHASTRPRITVERPVPDRLLVTIQRRQTRAFSLSIPEAAELIGELLRQAPEIASERR